MFKLTAEERLRKSRLTINSHRHGCVMAPVLSLGESSIVDDIPTACTNGRDKKYGREFMESLSDDREVIGVDMHEGGHIFLRHIPRHRDLMQEDPQLANAAMDYVVNDFLHQIPGYGEWFVLPKNALWDIKFRGWTVREVYAFLKDGRDKDKPEEPEQGSEECTMPDGTEGRDIGGKKYPVGTMDHHDDEGYGEITDDQKQELEKQVTQAIHEASVLAGVQGADMPRQLSQAQAVEADWRSVLEEYMQSATKGDSEMTLSKFNRKRLVDDLYMPHKYTEAVGRIVIAIDTSGSIDEQALASFTNHVARVAEQCTPDCVEILWWDAKIAGRQTFTDGFANIASALKPKGGGGTRVSCVSEYIKQERIDAECVIVLTDGYVESEIEWSISAPTLWVVTERECFVPPVGKKVNFN